MLSASLDTKFGLLSVTEEAGAIVALLWTRTRSTDWSPVLDAALEQLAGYDAGLREIFDLPLRVTGSALQRAVCEEIRRIGFGETVTYGEIARKLGVSAQAVGQACGANPIPILIPCHRVMGAKGLTGFSGGQGIETKVALLRHEKAGGLLI